MSWRTLRHSFWSSKTGDVCSLEDIGTRKVANRRSEYRLKTAAGCSNQTGCIYNPRGQRKLVHTEVTEGELGDSDELGDYGTE
jgi:hypothetical protein